MNWSRKEVGLMAACVVVDCLAVASLFGFDPDGKRPIGEEQGAGLISIVAVVLFFSSLYVQLQGIERLMDKRKEKEFPAPKLPGDAWMQAPLNDENPPQFPETGSRLH